MPGLMHSGRVMHHVWTEAEVEDLRKLLPKIANGRKTRYQKKQSAPTASRGLRLSSQQSATPKKKRTKKKR
jgi:hypothetical protein